MYDEKQLKVVKLDVLVTLSDGGRSHLWRTWWCIHFKQCYLGPNQSPFKALLNMPSDLALIPQFRTGKFKAWVTKVQQWRVRHKNWTIKMLHSINTGFPATDKSPCCKPQTIHRVIGSCLQTNTKFVYIEPLNVSSQCSNTSKTSLLNSNNYSVAMVMWW